MITWNSVAKVSPPARTMLLVTGKSGYSALAGIFVCFAYYDPNFRPGDNGAIVWLDEGSDRLSDRSWTVTHWALSNEINLPGAM